RLIVMDFSCGFQPSLSSGTRSRVLRVLAISMSNSGSRAWLIMHPPKSQSTGFWFILGDEKCKRSLRSGQHQEAGHNHIEVHDELTGSKDHQENSTQQLISKKRCA